MFLAETRKCLSLHFAFSLTRSLSRSFQSVTAKNRKEVLALLSCNRKEVVAGSRTRAQPTRNQPQEELLANAKRSSCKKKFLRVHYLWAVLQMAVDLLKCDSPSYSHEFISSEVVQSCYILSPHLTKPTRVRSSSATLIDNIFLNKMNPDQVVTCGNVVSDVHHQSGQL